MFKTPAITETRSRPLPVVETILLSVLQLELGVSPVGGWPAYLADRGIEVRTDDIGCVVIARSDAENAYR